jgi:alpha-tubulin suppressor-like RCC1 family protein
MDMSIRWEQIGNETKMKKGNEGKKEDRKKLFFSSFSYGQLGIGSTKDQSRASILDKIRLIPIKSVTCGNHHSVVCSTSGAVFSFG